MIAGKQMEKQTLDFLLVTMAQTLSLQDDKGKRPRFPIKKERKGTPVVWIGIERGFSFSA